MSYVLYIPVDCWTLFFYGGAPASFNIIINGYYNGLEYSLMQPSDAKHKISKIRIISEKHEKHNKIELHGLAYETLNAARGFLYIYTRSIWPYPRELATMHYDPMDVASSPYVMMAVYQKYYYLCYIQFALFFCTQHTSCKCQIISCIDTAENKRKKKDLSIAQRCPSSTCLSYHWCHW